MLNGCTSPRFSQSKWDSFLSSDQVVCQPQNSTHGELSAQVKRVDGRQQMGEGVWLAQARMAVSSTKLGLKSLLQEDWTEENWSRSTYPCHLG